MESGFEISTVEEYRNQLNLVYIVLQNSSNNKKDKKRSTEQELGRAAGRRG